MTEEEQPVVFTAGMGFAVSEARPIGKNGAAERAVVVLPDIKVVSLAAPFLQSRLTSEQ